MKMYDLKVAVLSLCGANLLMFSSICLGEESKDSDKVLRHAVFFKYKDGTSDDDVAKIQRAFAELPKKVDSIKDYQAGKNFSPAGFDDGYTHCFLLTFADEAGRAKYLPHPDHKAFGATLGPHLEKVFVLDYWGQPEKDRKDREVKHALFVKFKESSTEDDINDAIAALEKLPSQCDAIKAFEWGKNNSPEKHDEGFTHCFMFTFDDVDGLKKYAATPEHKEVVRKVVAVAEKGRVLDFWTAEK